MQKYTNGGKLSNQYSSRAKLTGAVNTDEFTPYIANRAVSQKLSVIQKIL